MASSSSPLADSPTAVVLEWRNSRAQGDESGRESPTGYTDPFGIL